MKKVLLALLLVSTMAFSEGLMFKQGINVINAGLNLNFNTFDGVRPGILLVYDRGAINNMFSLGGELGFYTDKNKGVDKGVPYKENYAYVSPLFRFGFHPFGIPALDGKVKAAPIIDPYLVAAGGLTFTFWDHEDLGSEPVDKAKTNLAWAIKPGIRWFFNSRINFWVEGWWEGLTIGAGINF
jgi:hypothetical protein